MPLNLIPLLLDMRRPSAAAHQLSFIPLGLAVLRGHAPPGRCIMVVAWIDSSPVGYVAGLAGTPWKHHNVSYLFDVVTSSSWRGRGIGSAMVRQYLRFMYSLGLRRHIIHCPVRAFRQCLAGPGVQAMIKPVKGLSRGDCLLYW